MQKRRNVKTKIVASLITFMMFFANFATLGSALVSYAADDSSDAINYSVQFVEITENAEVPEETKSPEHQDVVDEPEPAEVIEDETEIVESSNVEITGEESTEANPSEEQSYEALGMMIGTSYDEESTEESTVPTEAEIEDEDEPQEANVEETKESVESKPTEEVIEEPSNNTSTTKVYEGYAIQITVGVKESGYLKNAKVEIKDLANQMFTIKNNVELGEYIQSIEENKIKLKQINGGTEVTVYVPIELKNEKSVDVEKLQSGTTFNLTVTYVTTEGIEEVITKSESPKLTINNTSNLVVNTEFEKVIPYVKEHENYALAQIKVKAGSTNTVNLPVIDSTVEVEIPAIDGAEIQDVDVAAISTAYTNGLANGDVQFTVENWKYENGVVTIAVNNNPRDGRYDIPAGDDEYVITFTYSNYPSEGPGILHGSARAKANVFFSDGAQELNNEISQEYDLSRANSNIITYEVAGNTQDFSKGYLYGNLNADNPEYSVEFENSLNVNISRVELLNIVEIREDDEYFEDANGNRFSTTTSEGENSYYKSIRLNRSNLNSIIGENGTLELLNENAEQLIVIDKNTPDDGDGFITVGFGDSRINKVLFRINNPEGDGILSITATKIIDKTTYNKVDIRDFISLKTDYVAAAALEGGIITDMGSTQVGFNLLDTVSNATVSVSRSDLSTLVENEDVEILINLNNAEETSDMYKNPVFELTFPKEIKDILVSDINVLYGNGELYLGEYEITQNNEGALLIRVPLVGAQTQYAFGDSNVGTTIILKTNMTVDMFKASTNGKLELRYYNEDATYYASEEEWSMISEITDQTILAENGTDETELNIVAPEGLVNAQMITGYNGNKSVISVNQGFKEDSIETFTDEKNAQMKLITINNTGEDLTDVRILGRTMFEGNASIVGNLALGTVQNAPMTSEIESDSGNTYSKTIYYTENGEATDSLEDTANGWTTTPSDLRKVKSFLIVVDGALPKGGVLTYKYNFEIPAQLSNEVDMAATFATYYSGERTSGLEEADKVMLSTGEAPVLNVETTSDIDINSAVEGQHIKFTVKVTNQGNNVAKNVEINSIIPNGTTYIENGTERPDVLEVKYTIDEIRPGNTEERYYEVKVNTSVPDQTYIEPASNVKADGLEKPVYTSLNELIPIKRASASVFIFSDTEGRTFEPNKVIEYSTMINNKYGDTVHGAKVVQTIPENTEVIEAYVEEFAENGIDTYKGTDGVVDYENGIVIYDIGDINITKSLKMKVQIKDIEGLEKEISTQSVLTANEYKEEYKSNIVRNVIGKADLEVKSYASIDNRYIKEGDQIKFILNIKNVGKFEASEINIRNSIPEDFYVTSFEAFKGNDVYRGLANNQLNMNLPLQVGETVEIIASCTAKQIDDAESERAALNGWEISGNNINSFETGKFQNIIQQNPNWASNSFSAKDLKIIKEDEVAPSELNLIDVTLNEKEETATKEETYRIIGKAFNDFNKNGQRDNDEDGMENIVAKLCDAKTQEIVAQTSTNKSGEYIFDNVAKGEYYVKFEFDNEKYAVTTYKKSGTTSDKNSDAIVSNYKAVTDKITIKDKSVSDIDIGLFRAGIFDLDIDVNINQITVQNPDETTNLNMENPKLAKYDVKPQYTNNTTVYVEYTIEVSNKGEISGYAKKIVDYIPEGLELDSSINSNWYIGSDGNAYNNELENTEIKPGETKTIKLILTKHMTDDGTGIYNNVFEIAQAYNEYAIEDIDSTPGNNVQSEDDLSRADIIIGIQTGGSVVNVMIISTTLITLLVALYAIKIHIDKKNKEVIV